MIPIRLVLLGVTVVASLGYAIYKHYREQPQQHSYGPHSDWERPEDYGYVPPSSSRSSTSDGTRRRKKVPTSCSCSICLVIVTSSANTTRTLDCGHFFHNHCIEAWFNSQKTCPNCRATVS